MKNRVFLRKIHLLVFFICIYTAYMYRLPSAHAASVSLESGTSGSCTWRYEQVDGDIILTIAPSEGTDGMLTPSSPCPPRSFSWTAFSWSGSDYQSNTKRVVVKGTVKVGPSAQAMFEGFSHAESMDLSGLDMTGVTSMREMFNGCFALTSLDLSNWNVSSVTDMENMFKNCHALATLDLSDWSVTNKILPAGEHGGTQMKNMFVNTSSLKYIFLGSNFYIKDDAAFSDAGSWVGTKWMQVNLGKGGTHENPKGKVFESSSDLLAFHRDRTKRKTDREEYMRVIPDELSANVNKDRKSVSASCTAELVKKTYTITFDAGIPFGADVQELPDPIVIEHGKETRIPVGVILSCPGYRFKDAWNDDKRGEGASYKAGSKIKGVFSPVTLYAQWRTILTYAVKEGVHISLSRREEEVDSSCDPLGSEVIRGVPEGKEVMWTVGEGGGDAFSEWSYKGEKLEKDEIEKAALKGKMFVPTTFVAELVDRFYAIVFDANVPSRTRVEGLPSPIVVKHGQRAWIPLDVTLSCSDYAFTGEWNDDKDGEGASYRAGSKIRNVFSHITLYAQWERATTHAGEAKTIRVGQEKESIQATFPLRKEQAGFSGNSLDPEAARGVFQGRESRGGKRQASETAFFTEAPKKSCCFHTS